MSQVGTIPDNEDKRPPDLIGDQQANRAFTDPITFAEGRPPVLPSPAVTLGFEDVVREVATGAFRDMLKNVTINGVAPEVTGGSFNFAMPTEPSASVQFASLNPPVIAQPIIPVEAAKPTADSAPINWLAIDKKDEKRWDEGANRPVYGREENRREGESYSDQVTREDKEFQQQRRAQRDEESGEPSVAKRSGEGDRAYTERVNDDRFESLTASQVGAVKSGDTSYFHKGFIPILFTRKDGARKILARIDNTHSTVIEGAIGGERTGSLPGDSGYYEAGGGGSSAPHPFQVTLRLTEGASPVWQRKIDLNSHFFTNLGSFTQTTVPNLNTWANVSAGYILLEGTIVSNALSSLAFVSATTRGDAITLTGTSPNQTQSKFRISIAYIYEDGDNLAVQQEVHGHLAGIRICYSGVSCIYPMVT